jgi:hypothetical protein
MATGGSASSSRARASAVGIRLSASTNSSTSPMASASAIGNRLPRVAMRRASRAPMTSSSASRIVPGTGSPTCTSLRPILKLPWMPMR